MPELDEATIRACIEALDDNEQHYARDTLLALLPKPVDRAEKLVEDFAADTTDAGGSVVAPRNEWVLKHFARWMLARQPEPVDPVNPAPLTHDEIVKEAREWCARVFPGWGGAYRDGRIDNDQYMKLATAIITAWKGEK